MAEPHAWGRHRPDLARASSGRVWQTGGMDVITDERCLAYHLPGHPERPSRVKDTVAALRSQDELEIEWLKPGQPADEVLLRGHSRAHLQALRSPDRDFDGDTPAYPAIDTHARRAVGGALDALALALENRTVLSLLRPPGHHATRNRAMGFCYLSSIGISVLDAAARLGRRIAVFDFDVHHGNGTEALLQDQEQVAFFSVHQHPCYPGSGVTNVGSNCFNFPVPPRTPRDEYLGVLRRALQSLVRWKPDLIAVSGGFDAYARDPIAQETLEAEDFFALGADLQAQGIPFYSVLEGGYSDDLPELVLAYLRGIQSRK